MHTSLRKLWPIWLFLALLIAGAGGFTLWALTGPRAEDAALSALAADGDAGFRGLGNDGLGYEAMVVEQEPWLSFAPVGQDPDVGLILYPGGRVDPRAYASVARMIASGDRASGYRVVIVPMPLNLAVLGADRADEVIAAYPEVSRWAIGGHSLGGAMAARYAHGHPETIQGLVLWGAYPAASNDLSDRSLKVVSIYGTRDGLATADDIEASRALLPPDTRFVAIEGGNHAGFGRYGPQAGDLPAEIPVEQQQQQVVTGTLALLNSIVASP